MTTEKKIGFSVFLIGFLLFLTNPAQASITYDRSPAGSNITSPVNINFSVPSEEWAEYSSSYPEFCGNNFFWSIQVCPNPLDCEDPSEYVYVGKWNASSTSETIDSFELPSGTYNRVGILCSSDGTILNAFGSFQSMEGNGIIFRISAIPVVGGIIVMPGNALSSTTEYTGSIIESIGAFLWLAIGVPLAFYVIAKWLKTLP